MTKSNAAGKRIVSKGEYAATQTSRAMFRASAIVSLVEAVISVGLAVYMLLANIGLAGWLVALFFAVMAFRLGRTGLNKLRQAACLEEVLPLTQANAALLPSTQTLVRASSPSPQEQQNVLLRATINDQKTPANQLLRSTEEFVNTADLPVPDSVAPVSQEPVQKQESVLRGVIVQEAETPSEQRVWAARSPED